MPRKAIKNKRADSYDSEEEYFCLGGKCLFIPKPGAFTAEYQDGYGNSAELQVEEGWKTYKAAGKALTDEGYGIKGSYDTDNGARIRPTGFKSAALKSITPKW